MVGNVARLGCAVSMLFLACGVMSSAAAESSPARREDFAPATTSPRHANVGYWFDTLPVLGLGVGLGPARAGTSPRPNTLVEPSAGFLAAPALGMPLYKLVDTDLGATAVSLDLRLRGPSWATDASSESQLQPYLAVGPALFLSESAETHGLTLGTPSDVSMSVGMKAGAGINWQLKKNVSLFGEFRFMQTQDKLLSSGGRTATDKQLNGRDFLYGFSLRF